jgi:pimeloyl-ACP methyl ester carboxylesterase
MSRFIMAKTMTGYVDLDDGKLYYEMAGDGDILVLGHAGFVDSRMWDAFTQRYRVIRYDMRGFGKSDPAKKHIFSHSAHVPNMEEPEEFTQVVLSFLDGLK